MLLENSTATSKIVFGGGKFNRKILEKVQEGHFLGEQSKLKTVLGWEKFMYVTFTG